MAQNKFEKLLEAVDAFGASFDIHAGKRLMPSGIAIKDALEHLKDGLRAGYPFHPPAVVSVNGLFSGMHLALTEPLKEGAPVVRKGGVAVHPRPEGSETRSIEGREAVRRRERACHSATLEEGEQRRYTCIEPRGPGL